MATNWKGAGEGAAAGAGIGTMIMPGIGTAVGGVLGGVGGLLGMAGGNDPEEFHNPYEGQEVAAANELSQNNYGTQAAQQAEKTIGRRSQQEMDAIDTNPSLSRNAAASQAMKDKVSEQTGNETSNAYVKGAELNSENKVKAAGMLSNIGQEDRAIDAENYQRRRSQDFGNSMIGGLLQQAVGYEVGHAIGGKSPDSGGEPFSPKGALPNINAPSDASIEGSSMDLIAKSLNR